MKFLSSYLLLLFIQNYSYAQISPPGIGETKAASWFALGLKTNFKNKEKLSSITYIGLGRESTPDNYNLINKSAIYVVHQEFQNQFRKHLYYALGVSFRIQNKYSSNQQIERKTPPIRQELRFYGKYTYQTSFKTIGISTSIREEFRTFYNSDFSSYKTPLSLRTRLKLKVSVNLNKNATQKIISGVEVLYAANKKTEWGSLQYNDTRFSIYYSKRFNNKPITLNIGYMDDLIGSGFRHNTHYFGVDLVFTDLF